MSTALATTTDTQPEGWWAARNFPGLDADMKPCLYKRGDRLPSVQKWPTFSSLKNVEWITSLDPNSGEVEEPPVKLAEPEEEPDGTRADQMAGKAFNCKTCGKEFPTQRGMKVHMRYH